MLASDTQYYFIIQSVRTAAQRINAVDTNAHRHYHLSHLFKNPHFSYLFTLFAEAQLSV